MATAKKEYSLGFLIGAQLKSSFPTTFKSVEKQLLASRKAVKNAGAAWKDFGAKAGKLALGVAGTAATVGTAVWKMADDIAMTGDVAAKTAARLKMTSETYQELKYAFGQAGMGAGEFDGIMTKLDGTLVKASKNAKAAESFAEATGLSAEKLARMSPEKRIERIADYLSSLEDPLKRDEVAMELFGKSALEMQRVLEMGSEGIQEMREQARRTGNVISDEVAKQSEAYSSAKTELTATISGIKVQLFSKLIPYFTQAYDNITGRLQAVNWAEWGDKITGWVQGAIPQVKEVATVVSVFVGKIWNGIGAVKEFVGGWKNVAIIAASLAAFKTVMAGIVAIINTVIMIKKVWTAVQGALNVVMSANPIGLIIIAIAALIGIIIILVKNWDKVKEVTGKVWDAAVGFVLKAVNKIKGFFSGVIDWVKSNWQAILLFIINPFAGAFKYLYDNFEGFRNFVDGVVQRIKDFFAGLWENVTGGILDFIESAVGFFTGWIERIQEIIGMITVFFTDAWENAKQLAKDFIKSVLDKFKPLVDFLDGLGNKIKSIFGGKKTLNVEANLTAGNMAASLPGHAKGGIFNRPHIASFAENAPRVPEAAIPVENTPRSRSLWEQVGQMAGFNRPEGVIGVRGGGMLRQNIGMGSISIPIKVDVNVAGNADADTANRLKAASGDIAKQVRSMIWSEVPKVWAELNRSKIRTSFS